jgi:hypothetical protein
MLKIGGKNAAHYLNFFLNFPKFLINLDQGLKMYLSPASSNMSKHISGTLTEYTGNMGKQEIHIRVSSYNLFSKAQTISHS